MSIGDAISRFLEEECYTTPEKRDPRKPCILDGEVVKLNPDFNPELAEKESREREIEWRRNHLGTSFFLNFDPLCNLHQIPGHLGDSVRREIVKLLRQRFVDVFVAQFPDNPPPVAQLEARLRAALCPTGQKSFNNGEVYLWLPGLPLKEDFVFDFLRKFKNSIEDNPIVINIEGVDFKVLFYGWGFRYF